MLLTVFGIFTLAVLGVTSQLLFRVDIAIPKGEGRKQNDNITFMKQTVSAFNDSTGLNVVFAFKAFDNRKLMLVIDVLQTCRWSSLTSALSDKGYGLSVTSLQSCDDYAKEIGVDISFNGMGKVRDSDVIDFYDVVFYDEGMNTENYTNFMKKNFKQDLKHQETQGVSDVCYRSYGELPVRLMYLSYPSSPDLVEEIYEEDQMEGRTRVVFSKLQRLATYPDTC